MEMKVFLRDTLYLRIFCKCLLSALSVTPQISICGDGEGVYVFQIIFLSLREFFIFILLTGRVVQYSSELLKARLIGDYTGLRGRPTYQRVRRRVTSDPGLVPVVPRSALQSSLETILNHS